MTIRVRLKADKASVRFGNRMDEQYFVHTMIIARDRVGQHPEVSVRGRDKREMLPLPTVPIAKVGVGPGKVKK